MRNEALISPEDEVLPFRNKKKRRPAFIALLLIAVVAIAATVISRVQRQQSAVKFSEEIGGRRPIVNASTVTAAPPTVDLTLPGNTEAVVVADIYARATGYVRRRLVNIGDRVKQGQLLAEIESPEVDQELAQARANLEQSRAALRHAQANVTQSQESVLEARARLEQAQANESIAATTSQRWTRLVEKGVLPRQEGDERQFAYSARKAEVTGASAAIKTAEATVSAMSASVVAAQANVRASEANVARLARMVAFERVVAPFDGVITERLVEQGDLIALSGGVDGGRKLFAIAQPSVLRVQVNVPQLFSPDIKTDQDAQLNIRERPGLEVKGKIVRTANALNPSSRTLLVEVQVDNRNGDLLPGMYTDVRFSLPRARQALVIPADALIADAQGTRVAVIDNQQKIHFRKVDIGRDLGTELEIINGLQPKERLVTNPGDMLTEGQAVEVVQTPTPVAKK